MRVLPVHSWCRCSSDLRLGAPSSPAHRCSSIAAAVVGHPFRDAVVVALVDLAPPRASISLGMGRTTLPLPQASSRAGGNALGPGCDTARRGHSPRAVCFCPLVALLVAALSMAVTQDETVPVGAPVVSMPART